MLIATENVEAGEQLLADYGPTYFEKEEQKPKRQPKRKRETEQEAENKEDAKMTEEIDFTNSGDDLAWPSDGMDHDDDHDGDYRDEGNYDDDSDFEPMTSRSHRGRKKLPHRPKKGKKPRSDDFATPSRKRRRKS